MPGTFSHVRRRIVQQLLIDRGLGSDPAPWAAYVFGKGATKPATSWPVFEGGEPSEPDNVISVFETAPRVKARIQITGEEPKWYGFTIRVRGSDPQSIGVPEIKAEAIAKDLLESANDQVVTMQNPTKQYLIQSWLTAMVIPFGKVSSPQGIGLWLVNVNCTCTILPYPIQG